MIYWFLLLFFCQRQIGFYHTFLESLYFGVTGREVEKLYKAGDGGVLMGSERPDSFGEVGERFPSLEC